MLDDTKYHKQHECEPLGNGGSCFGRVPQVALGGIVKDGIHPHYRPVVFLDRAANFGFLTRSTARTDKTIVWEDGKEYPVIRVEISSASHPFYTGKQKIMDTAGRVEKFRQRYSRSPKVSK